MVESNHEKKKKMKKKDGRRRRIKKERKKDEREKVQVSPREGPFGRPTFGSGQQRRGR